MHWPFFCHQSPYQQEYNVVSWDCFAFALIVQNIIIDSSEVSCRILHQASCVFGLHCVALGHLAIMSISNLKLATFLIQRGLPSPSDQSINPN